MLGENALLSINKNKSHIHRANKNRTEASDLGKKIRIAQLLKKEFGLNALGLVDEFIFFRNKATNASQINRHNPSDVKNKEEMFAKYQVQKIDLFAKTKGWYGIIIEIDGFEHGFFDDITESEQTTSRNENYRLGGYTEENKNLVIITTEELKLDDNSLAILLSLKLGMHRIHGS